MSIQCCGIYVIHLLIVTTTPPVAQFNTNSHHVVMCVCLHIFVFVHILTSSTLYHDLTNSLHSFVLAIIYHIHSLFVDTFSFKCHSLLEYASWKEERVAQDVSSTKGIP